MIPFDIDSARALVRWYREWGVRYPWTGLEDSWAVWVSEVMLQQTTVKTVAPRFEAWMEKYPRPADLAAAPEAEYLRDWEGLGYYNRARNLASAAAEVGVRFGGEVPGSAAELKTLPGVGDYIAAAVSSFAFGEKKAAVDANGRRIAMRLAAMPDWNTAVERELRSMMVAAMEHVSPAELNGGMMQLGQLVCTPATPKCEECPLAGACRGREAGNPEEYPPGRRRGTESFSTDIALFLRDGKVFITRRGSGIGRGLWVFPPLPGDGAPEWVKTSELKCRVHAYTRFRETLVPGIYRPGNSGDRLGEVIPENPDAGEWVSPDELDDRPMPTAYRRIADDLVKYAESLVPDMG